MVECLRCKKLFDEWWFFKKMKEYFQIKNKEFFKQNVCSDCLTAMDEIERNDKKEI